MASACLRWPISRTTPMRHSPAATCSPAIPSTCSESRTRRIIRDAPRAPPSLRANGSRECAPDDRLCEAIHHAASGRLDCFVASLLAMTGGSQRSIRLLRIRLLAGLHQVEAFLDLAEQRRQLLALLRGEASQNFLLLAQQARDQLLVERFALARQP